MSSKVGVGILTYKRESYFRQVYNSLPPDKFDDLVVVNDGTPYEFQIDKGNLIQHAENKGIAAAKNSAIRYLMHRKCDHIFLIEDDILIKDPNVFEKYIQTAETTGIYHLNFEQVGINQKRLSYTYEDGTMIACYKNPQGAFSYVLANIIQKVGMFDEGYKNSFEHISFYIQLMTRNLVPPFWYFPDIEDSHLYLEPIPGSIENSTITGKEKYQENWNASAQHFIRTFNCFTNEIADVGSNKVLAALVRIQKEYGNKRKMVQDVPLLNNNS